MDPIWRACQVQLCAGSLQIHCDHRHNFAVFVIKGDIEVMGFHSLIFFRNGLGNSQFGVVAGEFQGNFIATLRVEILIAEVSGIDLGFVGATLLDCICEIFLSRCLVSVCPQIDITPRAKLLTNLS
jgi:hypothetical protein